MNVQSPDGRLSLTSKYSQENDTGAAGGAPIDPIELGDGGIDNGANTPMASIENGSGDADTLDDKEETLVSATGPITQEHMNYLRICNMIATVFADPLRDILLSQVPTGYTTIYKPPIDQPRDVSLSASVERIRLLRNNVWGHSVDGKFDEKACKDYLGEISQILDDVEAALGDKGYKGALEDRRKLDRLQMEGKIL